MLRITYKILSLPDLSLDQAQINQVAGIFSFISNEDLTSTANFNLALQEKIQPQLAKIFWPATCEHIINYLRAWHKLGSHLTRYNHRIALEWEKLTGTPMAADALVPLMIALLPNHPARIKTMYDKIDLASSLGCIYSHGYSYATLGIALSYKIAHTTSIEEDADAENIRKVADHLREIDNLYLINHLKNACLRFNQSIIDAVEQRIKEADKFAHQFFQFDINKEQALLELIQRNDDEAVSILNKNTYQPILDLYLRVLYDFLGTLNRQQASNDILIEFAEKIQIFYYEYKRQQMLQKKSVTEYLPSFFNNKTMPGPVDLLMQIHPLAVYIKEEYREQKKDIIKDQSESLRNSMTSTI